MNDAVYFVIKRIGQRMGLIFVSGEEESHFTGRDHSLIQEFEVLVNFPHVMSLIPIKIKMSINRFRIAFSG